MTRTKLVVLAVGLLVLLSSYTLLNDWVLIEGADFSMEFPDKPIEEEQNMESAIGPLKVYVRMYEVPDIEKDENYVYGLISTEYPVGTVHSDSLHLLDKVFEGAITGAVQNTGGKLLSQKEIKLKTYPGREFRVDYQEGLAVIKMRSYLVKNKLFLLQTICDPAKEGNAAATRFLDSFKLK